MKTLSKLTLITMACSCSILSFGYNNLKPVGPDNARIGCIKTGPSGDQMPFVIIRIKNQCQNIYDVINLKSDTNTSSWWSKNTTLGGIPAYYDLCLYAGGQGDPIEQVPGQVTMWSSKSANPGVTQDGYAVTFGHAELDRDAVPLYLLSTDGGKNWNPPSGDDNAGELRHDKNGVFQLNLCGDNPPPLS
jgi:hypothetical protein